MAVSAAVTGGAPSASGIGDGTEPVDALERLETELLLTGISRHYGYDFRGYAPASLARRIRYAMHNEGVRSVSALQDLVLHDEEVLERFLRGLTIHVTSMFRDADFYKAFRKHVIPQLRTYPFVRIWHAGCATGEEVYSMAILLEEEGLYDRARIYATDISDTVLDRARRGVFPVDLMHKYAESYRRAGGERDFTRYHVADSEFAIMTSALRRNIIFSRHNLTSDGSFNEFNVIVCRNVMIYFGNELRDRVQTLLQDSLVRFGYLCLGKKESLAHTPLAARFEELPQQVRIYRRNG
jgi:chemotaxis protein methyltransferase CheR